ncbi:MAG: hypothetical protein GY940_38395 [bacterium]|nr:hypothetical protein [bacterium]
MTDKSAKQNPEQEENPIIPVDPMFKITNKTSRRIGISKRESASEIEDCLSIPGFGQKMVKQSVIDEYKYDEWLRDDLIKVEKQERTKSEDETSWHGFLMLWFIAGIWLKDLIVQPVISNPPGWVPWFVYFGISGLIVVIGFGGKKFLRKVVQSFNLLLLLMIGFVIPGWTIYFYGGVSEFLSWDEAPLHPLVEIKNEKNNKTEDARLTLKIAPRGGQKDTVQSIRVLANKNFNVAGGGTTSIEANQEYKDQNKNKSSLILEVHDTQGNATLYYPLSTNELEKDDRFHFKANNPQLLLIRLFQFIFIVILTVLPMLLYFQFERQQVNTIKERFLREIMLFNPSVRTIDDAGLIYGDLLNEVSGKQRQYSLLTTARPVLLATILISLGWLFTLSPIGNLSTISNISQSITPSPSVIGFAFLGGYMFALGLIFRRYLRGDLSPKAYTHITVRILIAIIVALVVKVSVPDLKGMIYLFSFFVGVFPESGVTYLNELFKKATGFLFPGIEGEHLITELDGVSIYDRARFMEEGVENVESLAHSNLVELMLRTRIPTPRLVDLVDQAILYLHVRGKAPDSDKDALQLLKENGIRTATDLIYTYRPSCNVEPDKSLLNLLGPGKDEKPQRLKIILNALVDDEWLQYLWIWRQRAESSTNRIFLFEDFIKERSEKERSEFSRGWMKNIHEYKITNCENGAR